MGWLAVGLFPRSSRSNFSLICQLQELILSVQTFKLSCRQSRPIRRYTDLPLRPFFQVSSVRVRAQLAFGPVLALTQVGASGAPTRRCQVPNTHTLDPLMLSRRVSGLTISIFSPRAKCLRPPMISAS